MSSIQVLAETPACEAQAQLLRERFASVEAEGEIALVVSETGCYLKRLTLPEITWQIDFMSSDYQSNFRARGVKDPLARAIGLHKKRDIHVLDMTAGLGKDALWLAHCGATVTAYERNPVLAFLLQDALTRADERYQSKLTFVEGDVLTALSVIPESRRLIRDLPDAYQVAYYDPMFEPRKKSALVKKDMQILHALHGYEAPNPDLITQALETIPKVVVKRAQADPPLLPSFHHQIQGGVVRFDVYQ